MDYMYTKLILTNRNKDKKDYQNDLKKNNSYN